MLIRINLIDQDNVGLIMIMDITGLSQISYIKLDSLSQNLYFKIIYMQ